MSVEPFEPVWKKETTSIRRTLHVITHIRDEFLDSSGNVIKELRFEKRSLQPPFTVIPLWVARKEQQLLRQQQQQQAHQVSTPSCTPPSSGLTPPPQEVPRGRQYLYAAEAIEMPASPDDTIDDTIEAASDASSECSDNEIIKKVDIKKFAFWDCPKFRTSRGMKTQHANKLYIPVYEFSKSNKPVKVNVIVSIDGSKRKAARRDDLIYVSELEPFQTVQYRKDFRIGDKFPDARGISDKNSQNVLITDAKLISSDGQLNLMLVTSESGKKPSQISFWNCALPHSAGSVPHRATSQSTVLRCTYGKGILPHQILEKKRKKQGPLAQQSPRAYQSILHDLADPEDDDVSLSKRSRMSSRSDTHPAASTSAAPDSGRELTTFSTLLSKLEKLTPCDKLFSGYIFAKMFENTEDTSLLDNLIRNSGGDVITATDLVARDARLGTRIVIADKFHRKLSYAEALSEGIPIINLSWIIDCLSNKRFITFNKEQYLVKTELSSGLKFPQPYKVDRTGERKPFDGCTIALSTETAEIVSIVSRIAKNLGAQIITLNFSNEQQLIKQIRSATYVMVVVAGSSKLETLLSCSSNTPVVKMDWFIDCAGVNKLLDLADHVGYCYKK